MTAAQLTTRERQVLELIAEGLTTDSIATRLRIKPRTVRNQRASLYARLDARNESHAVAIGFRRGLLTVPVAAKEAA